MRRHWTHRNRGRVRLCARFTLLLPLTLVVCSLCNSGCGLVSETHRVFFLAKRTVSLEPKRFQFFHDAKLTRLRNRALARQVWDEIVAECPEPFSKHYEAGFISGFADYLYRGGRGDAPPVPPRSYWNMGYQSPDGKRAINDWYEGFRHGSQECKVRGYRELAVVPSSRPQGVEPIVGYPDRDAEDTESAPIQPPLEAETLPPPVIYDSLDADGNADLGDAAFPEVLADALASLERIELHADDSTHLSEGVAPVVTQSAVDDTTKHKNLNIEPPENETEHALEKATGSPASEDGWSIPAMAESENEATTNEDGQGWQANDSPTPPSRWSPYRPTAQE